MTRFRLDNQVAIITGGGSGIGHAIAELFSEQGATVHLFDIRDSVQAVADQINKKSGKAFAHQVDVTDQDQVIQTVQDIAKESSIDILINNAGIGLVGKLHETKENDFDKLYQVNVKGIYNCLYAVIPYFRQRQKGIIVNMSSVVSSVGIPDRFAYSMSKGATLTMTYSVAMDYVKEGIRCNCIAPARIHTPFVDHFLAKNYPGREAEVFDKLAKTQPMGRMGTTQEVANLALFLCSEEAGFITGCQYAIDGGFINLKP